MTFPGPAVPLILTLLIAAMVIIINIFSYSYAGQRPPAPSVQCVRTFNAASGTLKSDNYPRLYEADKDCTWQIETDLGTKVVLTLDDIDLRAGDKCGSADFIQVRRPKSVRIKS